MRRTKPRNYIRAWRHYRDLTLEALAERVEVTHSTLSRVERGLQPYNQSLLEALADALRCDPVDLLIRDPTDPEGIWSVWNGLNQPQKRQAIAVISALKNTGTEG